jgi:hypothetical protein
MKTSEATIKPVTIPHEVADAIEILRSAGRDNESLIYEVINPTRGYNDTLTHLRSIPFDTLMRALLDGYERELTEEEAREQAYAYLRMMYACHYDEACEAYSDGYCDGVEYTLNTLGIVIPGINNTPETEVAANV